jgi:hypothetical protein
LASTTVTSWPISAIAVRVTGGSFIQRVNAAVIRASQRRGSSTAGGGRRRST